ncbi:hypothetical protein VTO73DRAFT_15521 [Trametes versicolor]
MCPLFIVDAAYQHTLEIAQSFSIHHPGIFADTFYTSTVLRLQRGTTSRLPPDSLLRRFRRIPAVHLRDADAEYSAGYAEHAAISAAFSSVLSRAECTPAPCATPDSGPARTNDTTRRATTPPREHATARICPRTSSSSFLLALASRANSLRRRRRVLSIASRGALAALHEPGCVVCDESGSGGVTGCGHYGGRPSGRPEAPARTQNALWRLNAATPCGVSISQNHIQQA